VNFFNDILESDVLESSEFMAKKMKTLVTKEAWEVINLTTDKIVEELTSGKYDDSFLSKLKLKPLEEILRSQFDGIRDAGKYFRFLLLDKIMDSFRDDDDNVDFKGIKKAIGDDREFVAKQFINFIEKIMEVYIIKLKKRG